MAGIEKQDHDPGVEQQLQANRLVKEPGHGYRQKITERHPNESAQQSEKPDLRFVRFSTDPAELSMRIK
jgi:hypothetical protein